MCNINKEKRATPKAGRGQREYLPGFSRAGWGINDLGQGLVQTLSELVRPRACGIWIFNNSLAGLLRAEQNPVTVWRETAWVRES